MTTEALPRAQVPRDTFEARLMLARLHAGRLSIREAAERCGYTNESWSGWERGRLPRDVAAVVTRISERLGVDRDWLMWGGPLETNRCWLQVAKCTTTHHPDLRPPAQTPPAARPNGLAGPRTTPVQFDRPQRLSSPIAG